MYFKNLNHNDDKNSHLSTMTMLYKEIYTPIFSIPKKKQTLTLVPPGLSEA